MLSPLDYKKDYNSRHFASSDVVPCHHRCSSDGVVSSRVIPSDDLDRFISAALDRERT